MRFAFVVCILTSLGSGAAFAGCHQWHLTDGNRTILETCIASEDGDAWFTDTDLTGTWNPGKITVDYAQPNGLRFEPAYARPGGSNPEEGVPDKASEDSF